jgi:hypothetical protein
VPNLKRAEEILKKLSGKGIHLARPTSFDNDKQLSMNNKLNALREKLSDHRRKLITEGKLAMMTLAYTLTELGYAACQEMGDRFAFEYMREYKDGHIAVLHTVNPITKDSHLLILIAHGQITNFAEFNQPDTYENPLHAFLDAQPEECILVDPYSNVCGHVREYEKILAYNQEFSITHILVANSFQPNASAIMSHFPQVISDGNAILHMLSVDEIKTSLSQLTTHIGFSQSEWTYHSKNKAYYFPFKSDERDKIDTLFTLFSEADLRPQTLMSQKEAQYLALPASSLTLAKLEQRVETLKNTLEDPTNNQSKSLRI